jgi:hypothetical protein
VLCFTWPNKALAVPRRHCSAEVASSSGTALQQVLLHNLMI